MPSLRNIYKLRDPEIRAKNLRQLRYWARGRYFAVARVTMPDPVFIIGCSRSGTTVTYETITASDRVLSFGYELPQHWDRLWGPVCNDWDSEAAGAEHARDDHASFTKRFFFERLGRGLVVDKTCINVMRVPYLHALFPAARFVFIHRDGRDNISSMMDGWRDGRFGLTQFLGPSPVPVNIDNGRFTEWHFFLPPGWRDYCDATLEEVCAFQWVAANRMALDAKSGIPASQWIQVRYEDIFDRPVEMFQHVFDRLDLPFTEPLRARCASLQARPTSIVSGSPARGKWKTRNPDAIRRILPTIAPLMGDLGYEVGE